MDLRNYLNLEQLLLSIRKAGSAAHNIRNVTQGYVQNLFPDIYTIDMLSNQVENEARNVESMIASNIAGFEKRLLYRNY